MKVRKSELLILVLSILLFAACAPDSEKAGDPIVAADEPGESPGRADPLAGIYDVTGTDDRHGPYTGRVEFRPREDGRYDFTRVVRLTGLSFEGFDRIETAWEGIADLDGDRVAVTLELRRANWIKQYGDIERTADDRVPLPVTGTFTVDGDTLTGGYSSLPPWVDADESMTYAKQGGLAPFWQNTDFFFESHREPPDWLKKSVNLLLAEYHALPFYDPYRDRDDFKRYVHYLPRFHTDFDFYRENPAALRVAQSVLDDISLKETARRADAFRYTLDEKAALFDAWTPAYTVNEHGMIADYVLDTEPPEHAEQYDSLLWTGTYVASQAYRYAVTGEAEALENLLFSLDGIITCVEVTGDPTTFARTLRTAGLPGAADYPAWNPGAPGYEDLEWRCCGNNDMFSGVGYGYAAALYVLEDDPALDPYRQRMIDTTRSLLENSPVVYDNDFNRITLQWLMCALTGESAYCDAYREDWTALLQTWSRLGNGMFYLYGVSDWSGQHLNTVAHLNLMLLADLTGDAAGYRLLADGMQIGMKMTGTLSQPLYAIAVHALSDPGDAYATVLDDAIWGMRELPYPKSSLVIDNRIRADWGASPLPSLFWKLDYFEGGRHQGLYGTTAFMRNTTSCWWKDSPFWYEGGESAIENNGADYLHAYWLGRMGGVLTGEE